MILNEPIAVLVKFNGTQVVPLFFRWRGQRYRVEKLNLVHHQRSGRDMIYYFNVSDAANYFKLSFSTANLEWRMQEQSSH